MAVQITPKSARPVGPSTRLGRWAVGCAAVGLLLVAVLVGALIADLSLVAYVVALPAMLVAVAALVLGSVSMLRHMDRSYAVIGAMIVGVVGVGLLVFLATYTG